MQKPQVFISFRGKDERYKFLPHLKHHLKARLNNNVNVVTDDEVFGQSLDELLNYIKNSWVVIVIFSVSYLESDWCLKELLEIKKCLQTQKIKYAIPIFYKVEAYEVKEQKGDFGANFINLKNKNPRMVKKWKKALGFVAKYGGLTYKEPSSDSELDFIMRIVDKVDRIFAENGPNEIFDKSQLHLSKTLEALNLSYFQGFMHGSAWKDLISFVQSSKRFEIPLPESSIQFPMNRQRFDLQAQINESLEDAANILALHMMHKPTQVTQPASIFSNWDKLDSETKNSIFYSAHKKTKTIKIYGDVDLEPLFPSKFPPFIEELTWDKRLEPKWPQVWPHRANSFHDNREQFYTSPYDMDWPVEPPVKSLVESPVKSLGEPLGEDQVSNDSTGQRKVASERGNDNPGYFTSLCYCLKSCVCLT